MQRLSQLLFFIFCSASLFGQNVGIGTTTPNTKAVLDINSTSKGVLFPRMTTAQRDAIINPPDGLHIYNTTERGLNYYDSVYAIWNSYLEDFKTVIFHISNSAASLNFYDSFASKKPANRYLVIIDPGVTLAGLNPSDTGLIFSTMPNNATIIVRNHGFIGGAGGSGGSGRLTNNSYPVCGVLSFFGMHGTHGGHAIATRPGVVISVTNYGFIAGGGGGGGSGGPGTPPDGYGGGGGGGAGTGPGDGGAAGRSVYYGGLPFPSCQSTNYSSPGIAGTITVGGNGGAGSVGLGGGNGGNGGARGMPGQPGSDAVYTGGAAGKAIGGGSGNSLVNVGSGQSIGAVD